MHGKWKFILFCSILVLLCYESISAQNNVIYYTTNNDAIIMPTNQEAFGAAIINNENKKGIGCITFDKDITTIGKHAFSNCWRLTSITLPESVDTIGDNAFQCCSRLRDITFHDGIKYIGKYAFLNCKKLVLDISLLHNISSVNDYAFASCDSIYGDVSLLSDSATLGNYVFADCCNINSDSIKISQSRKIRFLTWNIEGFAWKKNYQIAEIDSVIESKGVKQMIAKYQPYIYTLNEVPYYLSKDPSPKSSGIKLICGSDEDKVHTAFCIKGITNAIVTEDTFVDREDHTHSRNDRYEKRHFGIATQYIEGKKIAIGVLHLTPTFRKNEPLFFDSLRVSQVQDMINAIAPYKYAIVAGDFNTRTKESIISSLFEKAGFEEVVIKPWYVDHIFIKGMKALDKGEDNTDLKLSDHPLLWADLYIE